MDRNSQSKAMTEHTPDCECRNCTRRRNKVTLSMLEKVVDAACLVLREDNDGAKAELAKVCDQAEILLK